MSAPARPGALAGDALATGCEAGLAADFEALRATGAARRDPVGVRVLEAMLRRLPGLEGPARTALLARIERRLAGLRARLARAGEGAGATGGGARAPAAAGGALGALLEHIAHQAGALTGAGTTAADGAGGEAERTAGSAAPVSAPAAELKALRHFRSTWSRLSLERQLARALAQAPDNAGPLNSHFLVLQALIRMRDIAPQYLEGFIAHVDALWWLERADPGRAPAQRGAAPRAGGRGADAAGTRVARRKTR